MEGTVIETLIVEWKADYEGFKRSTDDLKKTLKEQRTEAEKTEEKIEDLGDTAGESSKGFQSLIAKISAIVLAMKALKKVATETWEAIKVAMDVYEGESLFEISLGDMADSARDWSENLAETIKAPATEIRKALGLWTTMTRSMGLSNESALEMSKSLIQLKYDLMSFYNLDADRADTIIKGMVSGETEPAKAIGVILTEEVAMRALVTNGIIEEGQAVDSTTLMYGRYLALMAQTSTAHGNMVAELDSPANQLRQLENALYSIKLAWGQAFLPIVQIVLPLLTTLANGISKVAGGFRSFMELLFGVNKTPTLGTNIVKEIQPTTLTMETSREIDGVSGATNQGAKSWGDYGKKATKALDDTKKAVQALKRDLLGFDDLNRVADPKSATAAVGNALSPSGIGVPSYSDGVPTLNPSDFQIPSLDSVGDNIVPPLSESTSPWKAFIDEFPKFPVAEFMAGMPWADAIKDYDWLPDGLSEETIKKLEPFLEQWHNVEARIKQWAWSNTTITKEMAAEMAEAVNAMGEAIKAEIDEDTNSTYETTKAHFDKSSVLTEEREAEILAEIKKKGEERKETVDGYTSRISEIYANAARENRAVTKEEQEEITGLYRLIRDDGIEAMSEGSFEQRRILSHLQAQSGNISARQAADIVKNSISARDGAIQAARDQYDGVVENARNLRDAGVITEEEYQAMVEDAKLARDGSIEAARETHEEVVRQAKEQAGEHVNEINWSTGEILSNWGAFKSKMGEKWDGIKNWFKENVAPWFTAAKWKEQFLNATSSLSSLKMPGFKIGVTYDKDGMLAGLWQKMGYPGSPKFTLSSFSTGGFPGMGDLFVANEAGPELIGKMGNKNAVVNQNQIIDGIAAAVGPAVYEAVVSASSSSSGNGTIIIPITLGGKKIYEFVIDESTRRNQRAGHTIVPVGV